MDAEALPNLYRAIAALPADKVLPKHPTRKRPPLQFIREYRPDEIVADLTQPFIFRHFPSLPDDPALFEALLRAEKEVYGYEKSPIEKEGDWALGALSGREVWEQFQNKTQTINIVDSECSDSEALLSRWYSSVLVPPSFVGWVLTLAPKRTFFHLDPPYGNCFMYLCRGKKIWLFISPEDLAEVERRHGFDTINKLPLPDLLLLDDGLLWGKIQIGTIGGGDLMYFPDGWAHYVRTMEDSFGYGGYFGMGQNET